MAFNDRVITSSYLNTLDKELREMICYIDEIYDKKIINNPYFTKIRLTDERSAHALFELAHFLYKKFYTVSLQEAFKINDYLKYSKMINVSDNLLFVRDSRYFDVFYKLVHYDVYNTNKNRYAMLISFLEKFALYSDLRDKIIEFVSNEDNWKALKREKKEPTTLEQEFKYLKEVEKGKINDDYIKFSGQKFIEKNMKQKYKNKKIGNIGELYTLDFLLSEKFNVRYVAQDISDGFGFDFLALGRNSGEFPEILIDSKTTDNPNNWYFSITANEFNVLCNSDNKYPYHYFISRVLVDIDKETIEDHHMLTSSICNPNKFEGVYDNNLEYEIDDYLSNDKKKVYTWKQ